ncbi:MAG: RNA polymerase sigma factor RpoD/SigA [Candidatus Latescibacteria bacterium]|nr:RNA polymerase sigma factor RpoD/SigA [Candidatus Latescibacterota bacterium]
MSTSNKESYGSGTRYEQSLYRYLAEMSRYPLINAAQEVALAQQIKQGDKTALDKLVKANLRFVVSVARQYQNYGLPLLDMINEGNMGLMRAAKKFDETRGYKFISYAVWWIRQAIIQAIANQSRTVRVPVNRSEELRRIKQTSKYLQHELGRKPEVDEIAEEMDTTVAEINEALSSFSHCISLDVPFNHDDDRSLLDLLPDEMQTAPDENAIMQFLKSDVGQVLGTLPEREAEVIRLYFGVGSERSHTLEEIGVRFGLTRERIRQIKERALQRLRHASRSGKLSPYLRDDDD